MKTKKPYSAVLGENLIFQGEKKKKKGMNVVSQGGSI